ncbi:MAG: transcriptional repressor [Verrucomicrobiales bacterium]|nr:transcriptional repressor [Verrucomicrobiales bacterium]MED5586030.1 transcriptional repressor [Verrucomicrobiota bacterium]
MAEEKNTQERLVWAVAVCRERGLRRTKAMKELLRVLIEAKGPLTLSDLCGVQSLSEQCDKATVFRLLGRLQEKGVIRRLGLHERAAYYAFAYPGEHFDYLVCTDCGKIEALELDCPVEVLEKEVMEQTGFSGLYHELEFFGSCPQCVG